MTMLMKRSLKATLMAAVMLTSGMTAMAQSDTTAVKFHSYPYIQLQGGAQYTLGEAKFGDLISPNVQVTFGYQFRPWFGVRLAVNGWQSMGGWNGYKLTPESAPANTTYKYKYVAPGIDFMFNLSNAICGYNPNRVVNVSAFVGGGANIAWANDDANALAAQGYEMRYLWSGTKVRPVGRGGVAVDFRLSKRVSLGVEANANVLSDKYNSKKAGNADWYFNGLVGLKINLGKSHKPVAAPAPVEEVIVPQPTQVVEEKREEKKVEKIRRDVFFTINKSTVTDAEQAKVKEVAEFLKNHDGAKLVVTGYADAGTGTDAINDRLAKERAEAVANMFVADYGIRRDRIEVKSEGSRVQPFAENDMNRVSICVAE